MSNGSPEWYHLRNAVYNGDFATAELLVRGDPKLLDARNGIGETVLHFLAVEDYLPGIEWLHARGASLNTTNGFGIPLLFEVAELGYRDLFSWLVENGADTKQLDEGNQSIQDYLIDNEKLEMVLFIKEHVTPDA